MNRQQILDGCPEEFEERLGEIIDEIESQINDAKRCLDNVDSIKSLFYIEECSDILDKLSDDLY